MLDDIKKFDEERNQSQPHSHFSAERVKSININPSKMSVEELAHAKTCQDCSEVLNATAQNHVNNWWLAGPLSDLDETVRYFREIRDELKG